MITATELRTVISIAGNASLGYHDLIVDQGPGVRATLANAIQIRSSLDKVYLSWQAPSARNSVMLVATLPAEALQYADAVMYTGPWYYQVTAEYSDGSSAASNEAMAIATRVNSSMAETVVRQITLVQNYPNPFNPQTTIRFFMPERQFVRLEVYDLSGQQHLILLERTMEAGDHAVERNAEHLPSGLYLCRLTSGTHVKQIKMLLLK